MGFAATYYVSNTGNDANSGLTIALPWKTLAKVRASTFTAGDIILLKSGDFFNEYFSLSSSGSLANKITVSSYGTGEKPEIRGYGEISGWNVSGNWTEYSSGIWRKVQATSFKRLWINGVEKKESQTLALTDDFPWRFETGYLYLKATSNPSTNFSSIIFGRILYNVGEIKNLSNITVDGIKFTGGTNSFRIENGKNITIENCEIGYRTNNYGIWIVSSNNDSIDNVIIKNNIFDTDNSLFYNYYRGSHATDDGIYLGSGAVNCKIYNNYFKGWSHSAIALVATSISSKFHDNEVYGNFITAPFLDYARGIGVDYSLNGKNISVHHNTIFNTSVRSQINGNGLKFYDNIIDIVRGCPYPEKLRVGNGLSVESYSTAGTNMEIFNNTITNCSNSGFLSTWNGEAENSYNNIHDNNIFNNDTIYNYQLLLELSSSVVNNNTYSNNHLYSLNSEKIVRYANSILTVPVFNSKVTTNGDVISGNDVILKYGNYTTNVNDLRIEHNGTKLAKTISIDQPMIDSKGTKYAGSVTIQPFTSVILMKDLNAAVAPDAPTSVVATAGNATASVSFAAPANNGGSAITGYTVTSIPAGGTDTNAGSTSLTHTITGLTNGTSYTFTVKATNSAGTSVASTASNSVIPKAGSYTFTGPSSGNVNSASSSFTVTPNILYTGTITLTPTGTASTGLAAKVLTFSNSSAAQTFTITPTVAGSITLIPTNNGTLTNPSNLIYTANAVVPGAPTSVVALAGDATASVSFVSPANNGGSAITGYTVTSIPADGTDTNAGSTSLTHSITGLINGTSYTFTVKATNSVGSSLASIASNPVIPTGDSLIIKQGSIPPTHFIPVWNGENGLNHMNIMVVSADLEDLPLSPDDEIAVFSGSICVGSMKLSETINAADNSTFLTIPASQDDGSGNGFTDNDTIVFKIWDHKNQQEMIAKAVIYRNNVSSWLTGGKYVAGATSVVEIVSYTEYPQTIPLKKGYNMISTFVSAQDPLASQVTKTLADQGYLIKLQDEAGNSLEDWGSFGGWINNVGSFTNTEGYKIKVSDNCSLQLAGRPIALPLDIPLKSGWNIISFPRNDLVNAMNIIQPLIDQNKLIKVQDEAGNSIENWGIFGGWKNGIGYFTPGKAYKVKMNADAILTIQENYLKSTVILASKEQTEYFSTEVEGNGSEHVNINIVGLSQAGIAAGDEFAAFDGDICVGALKITGNHLIDGTASLVASISSDENTNDGFTEGHVIQIIAWNKITGDESEVQADVINGQLKYAKNSSVLLNVKSLTTDVRSFQDIVTIDVFPNPSQGMVTVRFSNFPDAGGSIEILDISGRKVASRIVTGMSEVFNLDQQPPGIYLVKSKLGLKETVQKLVIN
jgi:hypothetical protein